jgi:quercetin dioxygenase-like cupin family protein
MTNASIIPLDDSALALFVLHVGAEEPLTVADDACDSLLYVFEGEGTLRLDGSHAVGPGTAMLVLAGERAELASATALAVIRVTVDEGADRHAPLGPREHVVSLDAAGAGVATGARSFQVLFGPHNGSTRATLFVGHIPPGRAPWHYHLYDEIVWVPEGPGALHIGDDTEVLTAGSAFRLRPRQVHIVENASAEREMTVVGVFTPAGSPSAAYLEPAVAAEYRFSGS